MRERTVPIPYFPSDGKYREELHGGDLDRTGLVAGQESRITIASNYGRISTRA